MKRLVLVLAAVAAALSFGCGDDKGSTAPEVAIYKPQTSIQNVLGNLIEAYELRDSVEYGKLFDDSFYFVFSVLDVAENQDIPDEWNTTDELESASNMFGDDLVERINLDFVMGTPAPAQFGDTGNHSFPAGTMKIVVSEVELGVEVRPEDGGENTIFTVAGDQAIFFLYPHPTEKINGSPVWYIIEWRDVRISLRPDKAGTTSAVAGSAVIESTWGQIKSLYN